MRLSPNAFFSKFHKIELGSYVLRDLCFADAQRYCEITSDPLVAQFLADEDIAYSPAGAIEEIKYLSGLFYKKKSIFWGIAESATNNLIGTIGFNRWDLENCYAEIAYDLASSHWRRGIMSQALGAVLDFAFNQMSLGILGAKTMLHNKGSIGVLEKFNFECQGVLHNYRKIRGEYIDVYLYHLARDDYILNKKDKN